MPLGAIKAKPPAEKPTVEADMADAETAAFTELCEAMGVTPADPAEGLAAFKSLVKACGSAKPKAYEE